MIPSVVATKPDRDALRFIGQTADTLPLTPTCPHCAAIKFYSEADNFCCMEGRIVITDNELPDNHLKQLLPLTPEDRESFRTYIRTYSNLFVFTSMGVKADNSFTRRNKEIYTFRVQGRRRPGFIPGAHRGLAYVRLSSLPSLQIQ
ncbi:hypothetical protein Tco_0865944 [Tanacetum coccineum]